MESSWTESYTLGRGAPKGHRTILKYGIPSTVFAGHGLTGRLDKAEVRIGMDGRGRCFDTIFIERPWRSVKYEEVCLNDYSDLHEAEDRLRWCLDSYNPQRRHQRLGGATQYLVHAGGAPC